MEKRKNMDQAKAIARREAIKSAKNPHVVALTIPKRYKTPLHDEMQILSEEERHLMQFHLRQMWAVQLVQNMKEGQGWEWEGIVEVTGKSRQTWNNVCLSKFSTLAELGGKNGEEAREGYRPVSNGFIRSVTEKIESYNWSVFTGYFRNVWDLGLCVMSPEARIMGVDAPRGQVSRWTLDRIGDQVIKDSTVHHHYGDGKEIRKWIDSKTPSHFVSYVKGPDADGKVGPQFYQYADGGYPLLDCYDEDWGSHNCWEAHIGVEELVFDVIDEETQEPDPRAREWHKQWEHERSYADHMEEIPERPKPADPDVFKTKPTKPDVQEDDIKIPKVKGDAGVKVMEKIAENLQRDLERSTQRQLDQMREWAEHQGMNWEKLKDWIENGDRKGSDFVIKNDEGETKTIEVKVNSDMQDMGFLPRVHLPFDVHPSWLDEDGEVEFKVVISFDKNGVKDGSMIKHRPS